MQITLVQSEVEEAIKQHIARQLTVANGTEMQIEFSATRGSSGITAVIDIKPGKPATQGSNVTYRGASVGAEVVKSEPITPNNGPEAETDAPVEAEAQASAETTTEDAPAMAMEATAPAQTSGRSLFKGLTKPRNN